MRSVPFEIALRLFGFTKQTIDTVKLTNMPHYITFTLLIPIKTRARAVWW